MNQASENNTRISLIDSLQENHPTGWARFLHLYGPYIRYWADRYGASRQDQDDICQDVCRVVVSRIDQFKLGKRTGSFRSWIQQITRNVCHEQNHGRSIGVGTGGIEALIQLHEVPEAVLMESDPTEVVVDLYRRAIELAMGEFSVRDWSIVERLVQDEKTPDEIAAQLGISAAVVRQVKCRVFRRIREELGDLPAIARLA